MHRLVALCRSAGAQETQHHMLEFVYVEHTTQLVHHGRLAAMSMWITMTYHQQSPDQVWLLRRNPDFSVDQHHSTIILPAAELFAFAPVTMLCCTNLGE